MEISKVLINVKLSKQHMRNTEDKRTELTVEFSHSLYNEARYIAKNTCVGHCYYLGEFYYTGDKLRYIYLHKNWDHVPSIEEALIQAKKESKKWTIIIYEYLLGRDTICGADC